MKNCFFLGLNAGLDLIYGENLMCIKTEGFKEIRKQLTSKQMSALKDIFSGCEVQPENDLNQDKEKENGLC